MTIAPEVLISSSGNRGHRVPVHVLLVVHAPTEPAAAIVAFAATPPISVVLPIVFPTVMPKHNVENTRRQESKNVLSTFAAVNMVSVALQKIFVELDAILRVGAVEMRQSQVALAVILRVVSDTMNHGRVSDPVIK